MVHPEPHIQGHPEPHRAQPSTEVVYKPERQQTQRNSSSRMCWTTPEWGGKVKREDLILTFTGDNSEIFIPRRG